MNEDRVLPDIGTPEKAMEKLKETYKGFLDSVAKFLTVAEFYDDEANENHPLPDDFQSKYFYNFSALKTDTPENIAYHMASFTALELEYIEEIKDNLVAYQDMINNGPDKDVDAYNQACDILAIKDEFTDLQDTLDDVNQTIAGERSLFKNPNDPDYDYNARQTQMNRFKEEN